MGTPDIRLLWWLLLSLLLALGLPFVLFPIKKVSLVAIPAAVHCYYYWRLVGRVWEKGLFRNAPIFSFQTTYIPGLRCVTFCLSRTRACLSHPCPSGGKSLPVSSSMVLRSFSLQIKTRSGQSGTLPQWQCPEAAGLRWPLPCRLNLSSLKGMGKCSTRKNTILSLRAWCRFWWKPLQKGGNHPGGISPQDLHCNSHTQSPASSEMSIFIFPVWRLLPEQVST